MSFSDHGDLIERNAEFETISNQSGDTLLLTDDETNVRSYADILRRGNLTTPTETSPGSQTDSYIGRGRHVTDF